MPDTTRTFVAVAVPEALELRLTRLQAQLAGEAPEGRWEVTPPFHVTLAFLGEVDNADLVPLCRAVAEAAEPLGRFDLTLEGVGAFPSPVHPRTVWAGVGGVGLGALKNLQAAVASAVARLNYPIESRPFHAHVTIGRFHHRKRKPVRGVPHPDRPGRDLTPLLNHYKTWHTGAFGVTEAVVFSSELGRDADAYAPLGRAPLRGRKPGTPH